MIDSEVQQFSVYIVRTKCQRQRVTQRIMVQRGLAVAKPQDHHDAIGMRSYSRLVA